MLVQLLYLCAALASSAFVRAQDDAWHLDYTYTLVNEELDPIVSPNAQSSHMHKIIGGSAMAAYYNYDDYSAANCSSLRVQADKSNYWMPQLYVIDSDTSMFVPVRAKIRFYYFLAKSSTAEAVVSFPKGLRILTGNAYSKAASDVASFTCQINSDFTDSLTLDSFNFGRDCPYGMKTEVYFPPCWDGYNLYLSDGSHMAYPSQDVRDGMCPWTHPIRLPAIQLEYTWYTSEYNPETTLNGTLTWANGDTTGYGVHGDFVNGWDLDVLDAALNDSSCVGINKSIPMDECPTLDAYFDDDAAIACKPMKGTLVETTGNTDLVPISALPGCNLLWASGTKPTCSPTVAGLDVSGFTGTDGSYIASEDDQKQFVWPTDPGWTNIACLHDSSSLTDTVSYTDSALTVDSCQDNCFKGGYQFAATGLVGEWNCVCGTGISSDAYVEPGMCTTACPGNSSQLCGASYIFNIFYAPNGTVGPTETTSISGANYIGCYDNPTTASDGLLGAATYSFTSSSMTLEVCVAACVEMDTSWAAATSGKYCYCGDDYYYGTGSITPDSYCTEACVGNSSEICGDYYYSSVYNVSTGETTTNTSGHPDGYLGCYQDKSGHLALTNNSWTSTAMTTLQCINGCSELGYSYAGLESGNTCYCGSTVSTTVTVLPSSQCQTACTGNSSTTCGGSSALDLYNMEAAVNTSTSITASKPSGYLGCFKDAGSNLAFNNYYSYTFSSMTVEVCKAACVELGYTYAGVEDSQQCRCGDNYPQTTQMVSGLYCAMSCNGNTSETCGGSGYLEGYSVANVTNSTIMPGSSASAYIGCYVNNDRGLTNYSYSDSSMTVEACRTTCAEFGYSLADVYISRYCGCGDSWTGATLKYPSSACEKYSCAGNSSEWCGGSSQAALYSTTGVSVTYDKPTGWIACWTDSSSSRSLTSYSYSATAMTSHACRVACNNLNYTYAGTESGNQCYCGNTLGGEKAPTSECKTSCTGSTGETCGGSGYMDLYNATGAAADNGISGYVGCYTDDTVLAAYSYSSDYMSVDICAQWCIARGTAYAGVRNGNQCKCGNTSPSLVTTLAACANPCSANSSEACGTSSAIGVYKLSSTIVQSGDFPISYNSSGFVGCYKEGTTRMLPSYSFSSSSMTNDLCMSNCKALGYTLAGTEYAEQCWCANSLNSTSGGYRVLDSDCATACKGGTGVCGGSSMLSVYDTVNTTSASTTAEGYVGCYAPGTYITATPFTYNGDYMTTELCRRTCRFSGYSIAGLTNANACYCSSTANYGSAVAPATCNDPCKGNSTETCGATYSNALSIYDTTGAGSQVPSGYTSYYVGCISDGSPRKLANYSFTNNGMTNAMCQKVCVAAGYPSFGTESANECYCGSSKLSPSLLPDSYCSSACKGLSTQYCGGGGRLSYSYIDSSNTTTTTTTSSSATANATSTVVNSTSSTISAVTTTNATSSTVSATTNTTSVKVSASATNVSTSASMTSTVAASANVTSSAVSSSKASSAAVSSSMSSNSSTPTSTMPSVSATYNVTTVPASSTTTSTPAGVSLTSSNASVTTITAPKTYNTSTSLSTSQASSSAANSSTAASSAKTSSASSSASASTNATSTAVSSSATASSVASSSASASKNATSTAVSSSATASSVASSSASASKNATSTAVSSSASASTNATSTAVSSSTSASKSATSTAVSSVANMTSTATSTSTSSAASATGTSLGCYTGSSSAFSSSKMTSHDDLTTSMCQIWCNANYYTYAGLSGGNTCGCSNNITSITTTSSSSCSTACSGDSSASCGGTADGVYSVYLAQAATQSKRSNEEQERRKYEGRRATVHARRVDRKGGRSI